MSLFMDKWPCLIITKVSFSMKDTVSDVIMLIYFVAFSENLKFTNEFIGYKALQLNLYQTESLFRYDFHDLT